MRNLLLCAVASGCGGDPITVYGEVSSSLQTQGSADLSIVIHYSPEESDHESVGTHVVGQFPTAFRIDVPFPPGHVFEEESPGVELAAGAIWMAKPGTTELVDWTGYYVLYLDDPPGEQTPFGVSGLDPGWNLIKTVPFTCADRIPRDDGLYTYDFRYEKLPLDTIMHAVIGQHDPWQTPLVCP